MASSGSSTVMQGTSRRREMGKQTPRRYYSSKLDTVTPPEPRTQHRPLTPLRYVSRLGGIGKLDT